MRNPLFFLVGIFLFSSCSNSLDKYLFPEITPSESLIIELKNSRNLIKKIEKSSIKKSFKIQFHGQSIVKGIKEKRIKEILAKTFKTVDFEIVNTARSGFQVPQLLPLIEEDVYPQNANLLFFHAYGGTETGELDQFLKNLKNNFEGDVIIFNHHLSFSEDLIHNKELTDLENRTSIQMFELAEKYDFGFIDLRYEWHRFLSLNKQVSPSDLLRDHVHPNKDGKLILESILMSHFIKAINYKS